MVETIATHDWLPHMKKTGAGLRYTRVAMWLHWAIAVMIIYNLISGLLIWDLASGFFKENRGFYFIGISSHLSSGMTVLFLTVIRIIWRLMHEPPAYSAEMKPWERHAAHFAHFLLYAGMLLMPLSGWAILSAHPPTGSPGASVARPPMGTGPTTARPAASASGAKPAGPKAGAPPPLAIWGIVPLPAITPIANIGFEAGGVKAQHDLHEEFAEWHKIGGYLMLLLLFAHIGGALKHQFIDKEPELERMGAGKRKHKPKVG